MKTIVIIFFVAIIGQISCKSHQHEPIKTTLEKQKFTETITEEYQLYQPNSEVKAVLVLFGGYTENAEDIRREFPILELAIENSIAVIISNFNRKLWLEEDEKQQLAKTIQNVFIENQLPPDNIYVGGFSSGGVVSLLISDFIIGLDSITLVPKGVFIVDSPIDLVALYKSSEKNIIHNFSVPSVEESQWLIETLDHTFGNPNDNMEMYENKSVFTNNSKNISAIKNLKNIKIRLYTEPDTIWWKENRMADYDQMNAFYIKKLSEVLIKNGFEKVEYIPTSNKGYRANGERHPHSWSIVDKKELIDWIKSSDPK